LAAVVGCMPFVFVQALLVLELILFSLATIT
jgi:hypothetical protein